MKTLCFISFFVPFWKRNFQKLVPMTTRVEAGKFKMEDRESGEKLVSLECEYTEIHDLSKMFLTEHNTLTTKSL